MIPSHVEQDFCPVPDELLGRLYGAQKDRIHSVVETLAPDKRALLALYCYRRAHLHEIGLAIAAICDQEMLVHIGARVGEALFQRSRECPQQAPMTATMARRHISLATSAAPERFVAVEEFEVR